MYNTEKIEESINLLINMHRIEIVYGLLKYQRYRELKYPINKYINNMISLIDENGVYIYVNNNVLQLINYKRYIDSKLRKEHFVSNF